MTDETDDHATRTVKVSVPVSFRLKLHMIKILEGQNMSETVRLALQDYFDKTGLDEVDLPTHEEELIGVGSASPAEDGDETPS